MNIMKKVKTDSNYVKILNCVIYYPFDIRKRYEICNLR